MKEGSKEGRKEGEGRSSRNKGREEGRRRKEGRKVEEGRWYLKNSTGLKLVRLLPPEGVQLRPKERREERNEKE